MLNRHKTVSILDDRVGGRLRLRGLRGLKSREDASDSEAFLAKTTAFAAPCSSGPVERPRSRILVVGRVNSRKAPIFHIRPITSRPAIALIRTRKSPLARPQAGCVFDPEFRPKGSTPNTRVLGKARRLFQIRMVFLSTVRGTDPGAGCGDWNRPPIHSSGFHPFVARASRPCLRILDPGETPVPRIAGTICRNAL